MQRTAFRAQAVQRSRRNGVNTLGEGEARGHSGFKIEIARRIMPRLAPILNRPRTNKRHVEFDQFGVAMRLRCERNGRRERRQRETGGERAARD